MSISGIGSFSVGDYSPRVGASSGVSTTRLVVDNPRLSAIIGDRVEISVQAEKVAQAFKDFSSVDELLRNSNNAVDDFVADYNRRRDLIIQACEDNPDYKINQSKLLDALAAEMLDRVSGFADDCVSLVNDVAKQISASDTNMVNSGWARGYRGGEALFLRDSEANGIRGDLKQVFSAALAKATNPDKEINALPKGKFVRESDFTGQSLYHKLEGFKSSIASKISRQESFRLQEASQRVANQVNDTPWSVEDRSQKAWLHDRASHILSLEDTAAVDVFSGSLRDVLGRFDSAASVYNVNSTIYTEMNGATANKFVTQSLKGFDEETIAGAQEAYAQNASRIAKFSGRLSDEQKLFLGVMYHEARLLDKDDQELAFKKVDAFAEALATKNFKGFTFEPQWTRRGGGLLDIIHWEKEDLDATGRPKKLFASSNLTRAEKYALFTHVYRPDMFSDSNKAFLSSDLESARRKIS